jgi:hypothetical protein
MAQEVKVTRWGQRTNNREEWASVINEAHSQRFIQPRRKDFLLI